ncbi:AraC family transcriptional regulator ligand-binding domain-containing protein (plasmid) [Pantoea sp. C3]|uniref:AraC family transcriptional regulator n=1 Tax=Pantoea phytostimulans TaxID=2769024 RepID=UPI0038F665A1
MKRIPHPHDNQHFPAYKIAALNEVLEEEGVNTFGVLRESGISALKIYDGSQKISINQLIAFFIRTQSLTCKNDIAFRAGAKLHLSAYGPYGHTLLASLSFSEFLALALRYHQLATPLVKLDWIEKNGCVAWQFSITALSHPSSSLQRFLMEQQVSQHITHFKDAFGQQCSPFLATFAYSCPDNGAIYESCLGCECQFNASHTRLWYHDSIKKLSPVLASKIAVKSLTTICDQLLAVTQSVKRYSEQVRNILLTEKKFNLDMETMAERLGMTSRTLRRRLSKEGTNYSNLMDDIRHQVAVGYLEQSSMSLDMIIERLGYQAYSGFSRAFQRRTGTSPAAFRARHNKVSLSAT